MTGVRDYLLNKYKMAERDPQGTLSRTVTQAMEEQKRELEQQLAEHTPMEVEGVRPLAPADRQIPIPPSMGIGQHAKP